MIAALVAKFGRHPTRPLRPERRARKRIVPPQIIPCQLTTCEGEPVDHALVHDLSPQGAGILCEHRFDAGTRVNLLLVNANHTFALSVEFEVLRCKASPAGTFLLGGRFGRSLTHDELGPFLT